MATIHPEVGRITFKRENVHYRQQGWLVRWIDVNCRERATRVLSDCNANFAALVVATRHAEEYADQVGRPRRVRV